MRSPMKLAVLLALASLPLLAAAAPQTPEAAETPEAPPRIDAYEAQDKGVRVPQDVAFTIRLWNHDNPGSEWRLQPHPAAVQLQSVPFHLPPSNDGGVGFVDGQDITIKMAAPGVHQLTFGYVKSDTGAPFRIYGDIVVRVKVPAPPSSG